MNVNWRASQAKPHISKLAMQKYKIRAEIEEAVIEKAQKLDDGLWRKMLACILTSDATFLLGIHNRYHFTPKILREIWEDMVRLRVQYKLFFRDGADYVEKEVGKNIEDTAILHDLKAIGVDIKAWEAEDIHVDEKTGEVTFNVKD